jgi:hypothetical protein
MTILDVVELLDSSLEIETRNGILWFVYINGVRHNVSGIEISFVGSGESIHAAVADLVNQLRGKRIECLGNAFVVPDNLAPTIDLSSSNNLR